ncbi:hypothetical protein EMWEY_00054710 [Eimeria maxima]|uniref:Uncharacterized protein n=1 Tax=Eimeria maxima TaxID=5804 RepID=U6M4J8_EIMMA|nr:hypothetical protein EMWEY_00054710 [Eimeria maxima]CDJ58956.1 hypothetical protein EMWEY_00054710 [Eimeria maxima]
MCWVSYVGPLKGGCGASSAQNWYPFRFFPGPFEPECEAGHSGASQTAVRWESDQALHERVHPLVHTGVSLHTSLIWKRGAEKQGGPFRYAAWLRYLPELRLAPATVEWAKGMLSTRLQGCHDSLAQQNVQQGEATEVLEAPDSSECPSQLALADKTGGIKTVEIVENLSKKAPDSPAYAVVDADGRCWECPLDHTTVFTPRLQIHSPLRAAQISVGEADQNVNDVSSIPPLFLSVDRREPPLEDSPARVERLPKDFPPQAPSGQVPHVPRNTRSSQSFTCWGMQGTAGKASTSAPAGPYSHLDVSSAQSDAQTEDQPILHNNSTVKHSSECFPKHSCRRDGWQILAAAGRQLDGNTVKTVDAPFYPVVCSSCQQEVEVETVVSQPGSPPPLQHPYSTGSLGGTCRTVSLSASGTLERALGSPSNAAWQNAPSCEGSPKWNLSAFKSSPSFPCDAMRASSKPERLPCTLRPSTAQITVHYTRAVAAVNNTADLKASMGHRVDRGLQYTKLARTVSQVDAGRMRVQGSTHFLSPVAAEPSPSVSVYSFTGSSLSETCLVCEDLSNFQDGATSRTDDAGSQMRKDTDPGPLGSTPPPPEKSHTKTPEEQPSATVGVLIEPQTSRVMELRRLKRVMRALYSSVSGTYRRSETKQQLDHDDATPEATLTGRLYRRYTGKQLQTTEKAHQFDVVEPEKRHGIGLRRRLSRRLLSLDFHATATPCSGGIPKPWGKRHYYRRGSLYRRGTLAVVAREKRLHLETKFGRMCVKKCHR